MIVRLPRRLVEIGGGARDATIVPVGESGREDSIVELAILILTKRHATRRQRRADGGGEGRPVWFCDAADRDRSVLAVQGPLKIKICLQLAEVWQDIIPAPPLRAEIAPLVIVARQAAIGGLHVDARATSHHTRLLVGARDRRSVSDACGGRGKARPDVTVAMEQRHRIAVENLLRFGSGQGVASRLDQEHAARSIRRQAIGDHAAGGAAPDNDVVECKLVHDAGSTEPAAGFSAAAHLVSGILPWFPEPARPQGGRWRR